jgi:starch synthase
MPSRFEPCGLTQLHALTYGTIPVVTDVGGLHDTVIDADRHPKKGTGFVAPTTDVAAVQLAVGRALDAFDDRERWDRIQARALRRDWSWTTPAGRYHELYCSAIG